MISDPDLTGRLSGLAEEFEIGLQVIAYDGFE